MKKKIIIIIFLSVGLYTWFGPWETYRIPQGEVAGARSVGVGDLPVWIGETIRFFNPDVRTQKEEFGE